MDAEVKLDDGQDKAGLGTPAECKPDLDSNNDDIAAVSDVTVQGETVIYKDATIRSSPGGILKSSTSTHEPQELEGRKGKKKKKAQREEEGEPTRLVPIWSLFRFATPLDIIMIIIGAVMAVASGLAYPVNILLLGAIIDFFITFDIVDRSRSGFSNRSCEDYLSTTDIGYFCENQTSQNSNLPRYITSCNIGDTLQNDVTLYVYYYIAMASGLLVTAFLAVALWNWAAYRQTKKMRSAFFKSILRQDVGWFDVSHSSELNTRLSDDVEKIQAGIGDKAAVYLLNLSTFASSFIISFIISWKMTLVVGVILPFLAFLIAVIAKVLASFTVREQTAYASAGGVAEEVLSSIRTVVAFGGENKETERYASLLNKAKTVGLKKGFLTALVVSLLYFVIFCGYALGFWYGATLIADCELLPGRVITVLFIIIAGSLSLGKALPELQTFAVALGSATAVFAVIDREPEIDVTSDEGDKPDSLRGNIEFKDVIFSYPACSDVSILKGLDLTISFGQTVALVGPSGCGKSTIIQLLQRFYNPAGGQITIEGQDIKELNLKWLRRNIGVVSQEPVLFDTTIAENICYGKSDVTQAQIEEAAKAANAFNFISELPEGFETNVGQRGTQLSGGQKQRIAIARALVRDPKILLLDEATSALDNESEKIVQQALDKAREGRTTIVIAHRLSTIQTADVIAGIEGGRVVEMGTHAELMDKGGLYYELVTAQTKEVEEEKSGDSLSEFKVALKRSESRRSQKRRSIQRKNSRRASQRRRASSQSIENAFRALRRNLSQASIHDLSGTTLSSPSSNLHYDFSSDELTEHTLDMEMETDGAMSVTDKQISSDKSVPPRKVSDSMRVTFEEDEAEGKEKGKKRKSITEAAMNETDDLAEVTFKELLKLNLPDWYYVVLGVIASALFGALFPSLSVLFSDLLGIFSGLNRNALLQSASEYAGYFVVIAVSAGLLQFIWGLTLSVAGERLTHRLRLQSFSAMLRQEIGWFDMKSNSTGVLTSRLAVDASEVKGATGLRLGHILQSVASVITALVIALAASWILTFVAFSVLPFLVIAALVQTKLLQGRSNRNKLLTAESAKTANEAIDNIRTVASLGLEDKFIKMYQEQLHPPFISNMKGVFIEASVFALAQAMAYYIFPATFRLGAFQVTLNPSSVLYANYEQVFRVFSAVVFTSLSIGSIASYTPDIKKAQLSASRIMTLLKRKPEIDGYDTDGLTPDKASGVVQLKNVFFNYPSRPNIAVLQGLSLVVQPGETMALVGPSGCGKSTVVSLVERFYDIIAGSVEVDNEDIRDLNIRWLRRQIGIVSQEPVLFDRSIADNIRYGANFREVIDEEIVEAAKAANINNFIQSLPEGFSTNVGSKGTQLSGGQKQRIAIARALVRDPKILLLDEATSALDTESEKIVQEALDKAREGRTCIVIAHRLSTIYNSDCIAVIHNGNVLEKGTHSELMAQGGAYYLLNTVQKNEEEGTNKAIE